MKFGLALPYNHSRAFVQWAQDAEAAGWDGCFLGDAIWCEDPMIALAGAATVTRRIRLGSLIIPVPLRRPWKIASESIALDYLSNGRVILGLGTGATWMGWHAFPDEVTDARARAEMLEETIEILDGLYQRKPFDFSGKHYRLELTKLDPMHYPPLPVQQPRIPIWSPMLWPQKRSMQRVLKCDGLIAEKIGPDGSPGAVTPDDICAMRSYVDVHRESDVPFDIVMIGKTDFSDRSRQAEELLQWQSAGVTWWVEDLFGGDESVVDARIQQEPPIVK